MITKVAHEVIDIVGATDPDDAHLDEAVRSQCACLGINYNSWVVRSAIQSAFFQRGLKRGTR